MWDLLDSKQPEEMAEVLAMRIIGSREARRELEWLRDQLTPEALSDVSELSADLLTTYGYVGTHFNNVADGVEQLIRYVKMQIGVEKGLVSESTELEDW